MLTRADARYCSTRCRVAAHRAARSGVAERRVPMELAQRARWIRHTKDKVPLTVRGTGASSTDPATWCDFDTAFASSVGSGLGFVLNGDGVVCIDLDHCLENGEPLPWVEPVLAMLPRTFVEVSPSGDGLHVWGFGRIATGRRLRINGGGVELYGNARYLTVTRKPYGKLVASLADLQSVIDVLLGGFDGC